MNFDRIYRRLLRLYPALHRQEFADEMTDVFHALAADARKRGFLGYAAFCVREFSGLSVNIWQGNRQLQRSFVFLLVVGISAGIVIFFQGPPDIRSAKTSIEMAVDESEAWQRLAHLPPRETWLASWRRKGREMKQTGYGTIVFKGDLSDVSAAGPESFLELIERSGSATRRMFIIRANDGDLSYRWLVNSKEQPLDEHARSWLASRLLELERHTAYGAKQRVEYLLRAAGIDGVLAELPLLDGDNERRVYVLEALRTGMDLTTKTRLMKAAKTMFLDQAEWTKLVSSIPA